MSRALLGLVIFGLIGITQAMPAVAADERHATTYRGPNPYCGPRCGCPAVTFVRHRELRQSYASTLDPRERDEPRYSYGAMKTYARYENRGAPEGYWTK